MRHESRPSLPWITAVLALTAACLLPARAVRAEATAPQGPGLYLARPAKDGNDALKRLSVRKRMSCSKTFLFGRGPSRVLLNSILRYSILKIWPPEM